MRIVYDYLVLCHTIHNYQIVECLEEMDTTELITAYQYPCQRRHRFTFSWTNMIITLCFWTLLLQNPVRSEVYSSASDMKNIFRMEMDLTNSLNKYAKKMQAKLDRINGYIQV